MRPSPILLHVFRYWRQTAEQFVDTHGRDYANNLAYRIARQARFPSCASPKTKLRLP